MSGAHANGYFHEPTIFADVDPSMRIAQEEIFGPVVSVIRCGSFEQAIAIANDVSTDSRLRFTRRTSTAPSPRCASCYTGIFYVNAPTIGAEVHLPFGGTKSTGNGHREAGTAALDVFSEWKSMYHRFQRAIAAGTDRRGRILTVRIAVIPGDGIGIDVTAEAMKVVRAAGETFGRYVRSRRCCPTARTITFGRGSAFLQTATPCSGTSSTPSSSARSAIRAFRTCGMRGTSCWAPDLRSTLRQLPARSTARRATLSPQGSRAVRHQFRRLSGKTPRASTSTSAGASSPTPKMKSPFKKRSTRTRVHRIIKHALRLCKGTGLDPGLHGRQEQRDDSRPCAVAARLLAAGWCQPGDSVDTPLHRRAGDAARQEPGAVRGHRHEQHVRRHHHGSRRAAAGRPRVGSIRQFTSWSDIDVRAGAWFGAQLRRKELCESGRRHPVGRAHVGVSRPRGRGGCHRRRGEGSGCHA